MHSTKRPGTLGLPRRWADSTSLHSQRASLVSGELGTVLCSACTAVLLISCWAPSLDHHALHFTTNLHPTPTIRNDRPGAVVTLVVASVVLAVMYMLGMATFSKRGSSPSSRRKYAPGFYNLPDLDSKSTTHPTS